MEFDDKNVAFNNVADALVFSIAKTGKPYKPFALQPERDGKGKETGWYSVPKSLVFAYRSEKLLDGSRCNVMRTKSVSRDERIKLRDAGLAKGLKVRDIEPEKESKERGPALTLDELTGGIVSEAKL